MPPRYKGSDRNRYGPPRPISLISRICLLPFHNSQVQALNALIIQSNSSRRSDRPHSPTYKQSQQPHHQPFQQPQQQYQQSLRPPFQPHSPYPQQGPLSRKTHTDKFLLSQSVNPCSLILWVCSPSVIPTGVLFNSERSISELLDHLCEHHALFRSEAIDPQDRKDMYPVYALDKPLSLDHPVL